MATATKKPDGKLVINVKKGALHKELGVSPDENIPAKKLDIKSSDTPLEQKRKQFAQNAKSWNKG